ncbi:MAG: aminotransferase [bacterium]|nr:aminotransferase [bacterium]MDE0287274.1 aminotransferase [bacterium]MDE0438998.1 aminotransferase [bacterium]
MDRASPGLNRRVLATVSSPISEVRSWVAAGLQNPDLPLIDVAQAAPGYPPDRGLIEHVSRLDQAQVSRYGPVLGEAPLRAALAEDLSTSYGGVVRPEQVAITAGANQAFCLAVSVLCEPGDRVVMPVPHYFNYDMWLNMAGVEAAYLECSEGMLPPVEGAAALVDERTRAIVLVTPNNPTGRVYPPKLISDFAGLAAEAGIHLIVDETYRDFRHTTARAHDLFGDPQWDRTVIHIESFSKVYSIPGYRVGAMAASPDLLHEADKVADCLTICPSRIGQEAALYGLGHLAGWVEANRSTMNRRVRQFGDVMRDSSYEVVSAGAYFAYVRHPFEGVPGVRVARRLFEEYAVLCLAGEMFGPDQDRYLRLAFANLEDRDIPELARRLDESASGV